MMLKIAQTIISRLKVVFHVFKICKERLYATLRILDKATLPQSSTSAIQHPLFIGRNEFPLASNECSIHFHYDNSKRGRLYHWLRITALC